MQLQIGKKTARVARSMKNSGLYLDTSLTMVIQVNAISDVCSCNIRNIGCTKQYITTDACKILVTSRQDCSNALLRGLPSTLMERL